MDSNTEVYKSINLISVIAGGVLGIGMYVDNHSATVSALGGVALYGGMATLLITGPLIRDVACTWLQEGTLRHRDELPYRVGEGLSRVEVVNHPQLPYTEPAQEQPQIEQRRFVAPVPRTSGAIRAEAVAWIAQLFDLDTGKPLPTKITPKKGQIQHKSPSPETVEYLLGLEVVKRGDGLQLYWNRDSYSGYPHYQEAITAIRTGVRKASWVAGEGREGEGSHE